MRFLKNRPFRAIPLAATLSVIVFGAVSMQADIIPPGGLSGSLSNGNLVVSLVASNAQFFTLQSSTDLCQWSNCAPGIPGDGTVKSVTVTNVTAGGEGFYRFVVQTPFRLELDQSTAFSILGYDCGGIKEQISASLDVVTGYPTGVVDLSTSCSGSGRGGHSVTHSASAVVTWDFAGNVTSAISVTNNPSPDPTQFSDGLGDYVYTSGTYAYLVVPVPTAPTNIVALQTGDQLQISWLPTASNPTTIISTAIIATPVDSEAPALTNAVAGTETNGIIPTLQPATTYQITVVNATISGFSHPSAPLNFTTAPATVPPAAPVGISASWSNPDPTSPTDTLVAAWQAPDPGNSPIDQYLIKIVGSDGAGTSTQSVSGTTLSTYFTVDWTPNWSLNVQAHNAAGWGPVSTNFSLGGL